MGCLVRCVVFHQVEVHRFYRPKNRNNSLIRVQKSNKNIANEYKKLLCTFKREAVQFLEAKTLPKSLTARSPSCRSNVNYKLLRAKTLGTAT